METGSGRPPPKPGNSRNRIGTEPCYSRSPQWCSTGEGAKIHKSCKREVTSRGKERSYGSIDKWIGVVLAANGKVVGIPFHSDAVLVVDPETNTAGTTSLTVAGTAISKYNSGVLAANNLIYAIPFFADNVLVIDMGC